MEYHANKLYEIISFMFMRKIYGAWMAGTQKEKIGRILEEIGKNRLKGKKILDVGSGPGFLSGVLDKTSFIISSDIDLENVRKINSPRVLASGDFLPFKKAFEAVFCVDTIHLLDKEIIGVEFAKVLKDNGTLVVSAFCNRYSAEEKIKEMKNILNNFEIEKELFVKTENEWDAVIVGRLK